MSGRWIETMSGDGASLRGQLRAFRCFLLLHGAVRSWLWLAFAPELQGAVMIGCALLSSAAFALSWAPRSEALAPRLALPALLLQLAWTFPTTDNHFYVELLAVALLCLLSDRRRADEELVAASLRWLAVIVLFHTGLQKLLYGLYFQGEFLAFMVGRGDRFANLFQLVLPAAEIARLQSYDPMLVGQGPYRVDHLPFLVLSNAVWIAEIGLAVLMALRPTRRVAALAAMGLVLTIQLGALEFGFAALFVNLLLLFTETGNRRLLPAFGLLYLAALAATWLPGGPYLDAGWL